MSVTLKKGQHHTFHGPSQFVEVQDDGAAGGKYKFTYKNKPTQKFKINGYATQNHPPTTWPVRVTNTGKATLSVGLG